MGDEVEAGRIKVPVDADISGLQEGFDKSKHMSEGFLSNWEEAGSVFKGIVGVEMLDAVKDFVVESVKNFAKLDLALDRGARAIQKLGGSYDQARLKIEKYADSVESLTQFSDEEATDSLTGLIRVTQDVTVSMQLNALAMDKVARDGGDLREMAELLGLAYQGNSRGLQGLAREMGIVGDKAKDGKFLFQELEDRYKGASLATNNFTSEMKKLWNEIENVSEAAGKRMSPAIVEISRRMRGFMGNEKAALEQEVADLERNQKRYRDMLANPDQVGFLDKLRPEDIYERLSIVNSKLNAAQFNLDAMNQNSAVAPKGGKLMPADNPEMKAELAARALKEKEKRLKEIKEITKDINDEEDEYIAKVQEMQALFAGPVAQSMQTFFAKVLEGTAKLEDVFEALGRAIAKSLLNAIAMVLEQKAAVDIVEGTAALASIVTAPLAPGFFAAAAIKATGAGAIRALAGSLANGGYSPATPGGRFVQISEGKDDEIVSPVPMLRQLIAEGNRGGANGLQLAGGVHLHYHGVKDAADAMSNGRAKRSGHDILTQLDSEQRRQGIRKTRGRGN